ncbi:MAG TPA: hypothetical protein VFK93_00725 [Candidatus Limnocylindria bacterium]|nr:hypothetical protein [Candidatus Limnocylindria bacterium]
MQEALTESFCERCGTRYEFKAPTRLNPLRKTRGLVSGLRNYIMSQDALGDAVGDAMRSEEEALAAKQLEAFHASFNFCIDCRQYTCVNCWNHEAGRCRACAPIPGTDDLIERFEASFQAQHPERVTLSQGATAEAPIQPEAWPSADLPAAAAASTAFAEELAWPAEELIGIGHEPETEPMPEMASEIEPEPAIEYQPEFATTDEPPLPELIAAAEESAALPEPEPIAAEAEPDAWAASEPAWPEPEPLAGATEVAAWPEPKPIADEAEPDAWAASEPAWPEPEPELIAAEAEAAAVEPEPQPAAAWEEDAAFELLPEPELLLAEEPEIERVELEPAAVEAEPELVATWSDFEPIVAAEAEPELVAAPAEAEPEPVEAPVAEAEPEPIAAEAEPEPVEALVAEAEPEPIAVEEPRISARPLADTILRLPTPDAHPVARPLAAEADDPALAARRAQLELLGLGDPGEGPVRPERPTVLPYRSSGAALPPATRAQGGTATPRSFWDASSREVAGAISQIGVQNCRQCGLSLSASARFCRRCGTRQAQSA